MTGTDNPLPSPERLKQFYPHLPPLGRNIRYHRGSISQVRLSKLAGFKPRYVGNVETGETDPRASALLKLARALGITLSELLEGVE